MAETIYAIQANTRYTSPEGQPRIESAVIVHEGYFLTHEAAHERVLQLESSARRLHQTHEEQRLNRHQELVAEVELFNREAAAIRAAGMQKEDRPYPAPFEPMAFEVFVQQTNVTGYEIVTMTRSEFDTSVEQAEASENDTTA